MPPSSRRPARVDASPRIQRLLRQRRSLSVLGIDDAPFDRQRAAGRVPVCGVVCRDTHFEGLLTTRIRRDGWNATPRLIEMIARSKFQPQLHLVLLDGIALGGLNVVDLQALAQATGLPCLTVMRRPPDLARFDAALERVSLPERRRRIVARAGPIHEGHGLYFQVLGLEPELAREALHRLTTRGKVPEALRLAHLIGGALVTGQSGRRA